MLHCYNKAPSCWVWTEAKPPTPLLCPLSCQTTVNPVWKAFGFNLQIIWIIQLLDYFFTPSFLADCKIAHFSGTRCSLGWQSAWKIPQYHSRDLYCTAFPLHLNTLILKLKLKRNCQHFFTETQRTATWCTSTLWILQVAVVAETVAVTVAVAGLQDPCWALANPRIMRRGNHTHRRLITMMIISWLWWRGNISKRVRNKIWQLSIPRNVVFSSGKS